MSATADTPSVYPKTPDAPGSSTYGHFLLHLANPSGIDARYPRAHSSPLQRTEYASLDPDTSAVQRGAIIRERHDWRDRSFHTRPVGLKGTSTPLLSPGRGLMKRRDCTRGPGEDCGCWAWYWSGLCIGGNAVLSSSSRSCDVRGQSGV